ncbi:MAG: NAD(P)-dependent alcohol dehydrogenase [Spirochaetota bacterium]|nr:NAD(P)-dependent alcohol dehydrogenase [Spirochaetota bacterium]
MQAIIIPKYGSRDVLIIDELEKPQPKENELLIKIKAATVGATDPIFRAGKPFISRLYTGLLKPKYSIPGVEFAGVIEETGKDVKSFKIGDEVFGISVNFGVHADYKCFPENAVLSTKPANISFEEAASASEALTGLIFLRDAAKIQPGQEVLINGASGAVGTYAIQLAKYFGAKVTAVCGTSNLELVKSLGADYVSDYTREDFTSNEKKYDIIFDAIGWRTFAKCKPVLKSDGVYLTTNPGLGVMFQIIWTSIFGGKKIKWIASGLKAKSSDLCYLKELFESGHIKPVVDKIYKMRQIAEAHEYVETGHKKGSAVITLN